MSGELDPRLIGLLRASLGFVDALRDIGVEGEIAVRIDRDGARRLVQLVDVRVLDHLVVGRGVVVSFAERGLL